MRLRGKLRGTGAPLTKSVLFLIGTGFMTLVLAISVSGVDLGEKTGYAAKFTDVTGLNKGDSVRIAGVRVGQVDDITITDRRLAKVKFSVETGRRLPATVTAAVKYLNLVGQRYLELNQGTPAPGQVPGQTLRRGDTIPVERTQAALNLTQLFRGFQPLMQALSPGDVNKLSGSIIQVLQGEGTTVESLLATIGSLTTTVAAKDKVIGELIDNLTTVTETVNGRSDQLVELITTLRKLTTGLASDRKPIGEAVTALADLTTSTADLLNAGRAPLKDSVKELGRLSRNLEKDEPLVERFLENTPSKMATVGRLNTYGSWANFFLCQAKVTGVKYADGRPPPTGVIVVDPRCEG